MSISQFSWHGSDKRKALDALFLFVVFYALNFFLIQELPHLAIIERLQVPYISDIVVTLVDVGTLLALLYVMKKRHFDLSDKLLQKSLKTLITVGVVAFVLILASGYLLEFMRPVPPLDPLPFDDRLITFFIEFIVVVISGPIFEEVLFRGLLLKYVFADRPVIGLLVSSFLFVLIHPSVDWTTYWTAYWYHGIPGIILGLAYNYSKSIKVPVGVHIAINLVSHIKVKLL